MHRKKRHYTPQQKAAALQTLHENLYDVELVSKLLNIPLRTLYDWRKQLEDEQIEQLQTAIDSQVPQIPQVSQVPQKNSDSQIPQVSQIPQEQQTETPQPSLADTAFGMTRDEYVDKYGYKIDVDPYRIALDNIKRDMKTLSASITKDIQLAPRLSLALSRMIDMAVQLEYHVHDTRPKVELIKYEYDDETYHNQPYWDNAVYSRASDAFHAVVEQAKREYYKQQGVDIETDMYFNYGSDAPEYDLEEIMNRPWTPDDFTNDPRPITVHFSQAKNLIPNIAKLFKKTRKMKSESNPPYLGFRTT